MNITLSQEVQHEFRAWDIRNSKMVYHALRLMEVQQLVTVNAEYFNSPFSFFDGCKWMMFTGCIDKNDRKIFEGDLLKSDKGDVGEIKFGKTESGMIAFYVLWNDKEETWFTDTGLVEVVGNIYEKI